MSRRKMQRWLQYNGIEYPNDRKWQIYIPNIKSKTDPKIDGVIRSRTVQKTRRPAQPGQPARVRPAATRSEDSGGRTRVPAKLTRPLTGRLSVFGFQTRNTRPKPIVYPYRRSITIFRPDPARSSRYPTKSRPDLNGSGQISVRSRQIQPYFGQISKDPIRFRPDFVPGDKPETDLNQPETDETRTEKSNQISRSVSSQFFIHPPHSGRVRVGHKPNPARPVDTPNKKEWLRVACLYHVLVKYWCGILLLEGVISEGMYQVLIKCILISHTYM